MSEETVKVDLQKAEEPKKERTMQDIQQEFTALCTKAGHLDYQVFTYKKDIEILQNQMRELNFEAAALQGRLAKEKEAEGANNA
jgi:predicted RNase H-like nuclease (RuvC/YqgF family)